MFNNRPIVDANGKQTQEMRMWTDTMPITGNGVPTFDAPLGVLYTDLDGVAGLRLYSSNGNGEWVLV